MLIIGVVTGLLVVGASVFDEGEVVTLVTEADGREHSTQLWIVEFDGRQFLRANRPGAHWLARLRANPHVGLLRSESAHGAAESYRALLVTDARLKDRVNAELARKYRFADRAWGRLVDRRKAQVIELESAPPRSSTTARGGSPQKKGAGS
ncbi:MAG: hypothetical protein NZ990_16695 [Myxococcota bacterium]|nr:hypothetical protein [Myxococcota bacterium]